MTEANINTLANVIWAALIAVGVALHFYAVMSFTVVLLVLAAIDRIESRLERIERE